MYLVNGEQIRKADQNMIEKYDFPGILLMEEAGRKAASIILQKYPSLSDFTVLAGPGNNGGDGFVVARYLSRVKSKHVTIILSHPWEHYKGDAAVNLKMLKSAGVTILNEEEDLDLVFGGTDLLIDALLGTGIKGQVRGPIRKLMELGILFDLPTVAIDLPSGLNADTGFVENLPIKAAYTVSFQYPKVCHAVYPAARYCGDVIVADIGIRSEAFKNISIRREWLDRKVVSDLVRSRPSEGHKGTFGHALLIGGSSQYAGAIALSGHAALHIGAGLSTVVAPEIGRIAVFGLGPEVIFRSLGGEHTNSAHLDTILALSEGKEIGLGPGWSTHPEVKDFFLEFLKQCDRPVVLDADALNLISEEQCWDLIPKNSILTPHPGELGRLIRNETRNNHRLEEAEALAKSHNLVVILKGPGTIIADKDWTWVNPTGNSGMGTGGSGDVLTGVVVGLLAQGYSSKNAAILGVYVHGLAGDLAAKKYGERGLTASRIMEHLGAAMVSIMNPKCD